MKTKKYSLAVYIGRFQPFHLGHLHAVQNALTIADKVLVIIGSANAARDPKNPFTAAERYQMMHAACSQRDSMHESTLADDMVFEAVEDYYDDNDWLVATQKHIHKYQGDLPDSEVCIVGHDKDETTYYVRMFPQYQFEELGYMSVEDSRCMDATRVRELLFTEEFAFIKGAVPAQVFNWLMDWKTSADYAELKKYHEFLVNYKKQWANVPYPVNFMATDAVVVQSGHVLLVTRGAFPGKGLLALPGGYVDPTERIFNAALRELREETKIAMDEDVLRSKLVAEKLFDDPRRSLHGRVISYAYLFRLKDTKKLPKVKGADDAVKAQWVPIAKLKPEMLYTDHYHIIMTLLGMAKNNQN